MLAVIYNNQGLLCVSLIIMIMYSSSNDMVFSLDDAISDSHWYDDLQATFVTHGLYHILPVTAWKKKYNSDSMVHSMNTLHMG